MTLQIKFAVTTHRLGQRYRALNESLKRHVDSAKAAADKDRSFEQLIVLYASAYESLCAAMINISQLVLNAFGSIAERTYNPF